MYRKDNRNEVKGGILVYVKSELSPYISYPKSKKISNLSAEVNECLLLEINKGNERVLFGTFYRKGSSNVINNNLLRDLIKQISFDYQKVLLCGDFNFPKIDWKENIINDTPFSQTMRFYNCLQDSFLRQHVKEFTRVRGKQEPSLLDLIITEDTQLQVSPTVKYLSPVGKSDHAVLKWKYLVTIDGGNDTERDAEKKDFNYYKGNYNAFRDLCSNTNWDELMGNCTDINEMLDIFVSKVDHYKTETVPLFKSGPRKKKQPWMNSAALKATKKKYFAWKRFTQSKVHTAYIKYVKERDKTNKKIRKAKRSFEQKLARECKQNPKAFYKYCNFKAKKKSNFIRLYTDSHENNLATNDKDNADILNSFFGSVFSDEDDSPELIFNAASSWLFRNDDDDDNDESDEPLEYHGPTVTESLLGDIDISASDIYDLLNDLDTTKSSASNCIHPRLLKEAANQLTKPILMIFRLSVSTGTVPSKWKNVIVSPIHKADDRHSPKNYRPITITSVLCRLLEKLIKKKLMNHLLSNGVIPSEQHGFMQQKSCLTNLLETMEDISKWQDMGIPVDEVFLDFAKAFDKVPHQRLIYKLEKLGLHGHLLAWIQSFLSQRTQRVRIRNSLSNSTRITSGVPQGSVLGPVLFIAYICDLPAQILSRASIFADDTKIFHGIASLKDAENLQRDLDTLHEWCSVWGMQFNVSKCFVMHYGTKNSRFLYHINGMLLTPCEKYKDLGVVISKDLKAAEQVANCVTKANTMVGMIRRTFTYIDKDILLRTYKVFVRPILEYCQQVWAPYLKKDIDELENVQRRATKLIHDLKDLPYEERLAKLGLYKLSDRRLRGDMIFLYKIFHGLTNLDPLKLFIMDTYGSTRGHQFKLKQQRCNSDIRRYFYSQRVAGSWNNLPEHIVLSDNLKLFKRNYDKHILNQSLVVA